MTNEELDAIQMRLYQRNLFRALNSDFETGAATYTREMQEDGRCDISALLAEVERLQERERRSDFRLEATHVLLMQLGHPCNNFCSNYADEREAEKSPSEVAVAAGDMV